MRILHVLDHSLPVQSGYSFRSAAILREQRKLGWHTVHVTSPKHGASGKSVEEHEGFAFYRTPQPVGFAARVPVLDQLAVVAALRERIREVVRIESPDIIQAHSPCLNALAAFGFGKPVVYELRSSWEDAAVSSGVTTEGSLRYRASRQLETYALRKADAITTICEGLRTDVIGRGVPAERVTVVPNSVDAEGFAARPKPTSDVRARLGLQDKLVLAFIGSFFAWEGLVLLIEALPFVLERRRNAHLLLVGGGPDEQAMRAAVEQRGLQGHVTFTGQVPHKDVGALYDAVDVLAYPRLPMRLTNMVTPLKPLEAMAMQKAFVASDVGGHRELVQDGVTGALFRAGDPRALAEAIVRVADDPALRERLVASGLKYVREERTWARAVQAYAPVYERLSGGRGVLQVSHG